MTVTTSSTVDAPSIVEPPATTTSGRLRRAVVFAGPPLIVFALFLLAWNAVSFLLLDPSRRFLLPPPQAVIMEGLLADGPRQEIARGLLLSSQVAFTGLLIAFLIGSAMSLLMSQARWIERSLYPYAVLMQTIPILAMVPLLGFWFGFGFLARVVVCVIISLFPLIINTLTGLQSADRGLHDLLTIHDANRVTRLVKLQIPAALPQVFTGLRTAAGLAVIGAIVGDFFFGRGSPGLGLLISRYASRLQSEALLATVLVSCLLGIVVFLAFGALARRVVGSWADLRD